MAKQSVKLIPGYASWVKMRQRCNNPRSVGFKYWGGRGITICERWNSFANFLADMGERPSQDHSIDRIDNNGNYEPGNCRWALVADQNRNKSDKRTITLDGRTQSVTEWARELGLIAETIYLRLNSGKSAAEALSTKRRGLTINGVTKTAEEWSKLSGIPRSTILKRVEFGWPEDQIFSPKQQGVRRCTRMKTANRKSWSATTKGR